MLTHLVLSDHRHPVPCASITHPNGDRTLIVRDTTDDITPLILGAQIGTVIPALPQWPKPMQHVIMLRMFNAKPKGHRHG